MIVTGIRSAVSQTIVSLGLDLGKITTLRNLKEGLRACVAMGAGAPRKASVGAPATR